MDQSIEVTLAADGGQTTVVWEERGMPVAYLAGSGRGSRSMLKISAYLAGRERCDAGARMGELFSAYEPLAAKVSVREADGWPRRAADHPNLREHLDADHLRSPRTANRIVRIAALSVIARCC